MAYEVSEVVDNSFKNDKLKTRGTIYCDTIEDKKNIDTSKFLIGTVLIIIETPSDGIDSYMLNSYGEWKAK